MNFPDLRPDGPEATPKQQTYSSEGVPDYDPIRAWRDVELDYPLICSAEKLTPSGLTLVIGVRSQEKKPEDTTHLLAG